LKRTVAIAKTSQERHKHACIIVKGGAIQGYGVNTRRNIPGIIDNIDALGDHAEARALKNSTKTEGAVAFIARVNKNDQERMSRPCPKCIKALKEAGIKKIVYTIDGSMYL